MHRFTLTAVLLSALAGAPAFAQQKNPVVVMDTSLGKIYIELNPKKAPGTVKNFLKYVDGKHYDGTIYHRVISNFMIQGGGFSTKGEEKGTGKGIQNESKNGLSNERGTIAMARTGQPHSATAQFYINVADNKGLDGSNFKWGYAVFGKVTKGLEVVDKIRNVQTGARKMKARGPTGQLIAQPFDDVPLQQVVIKSVRRLKSQ